MEIPADTLEDSDQLLNSHKMVYFVFDWALDKTIIKCCKFSFFSMNLSPSS